MAGSLPNMNEAVQLAGGPLGEQLSKFPLRFSKAAFFGERPSRTRPTVVRNGTVSFVDLGSGPIGITCSHVLREYRRMLKEYGSIVFQIGDLELDPIEQLIAENVELDLATIRFTEDQAKAISSEGEIGSCFFRPPSWPPSPVLAGESVVFGGFPGDLRERPAHDEVVFLSWSSGGCSVTSSHDDRFSTQFEREYWVSSFGAPNHMNLQALGGMSGGPAFVHRGLHFEFVGIIYEFTEAFDIMFFRHSSSILADGSINHAAA